MSRFKLFIVAALALGLAAPAVAHHNPGHDPAGNAYGHTKEDNLNKGKGHGEDDANHEKKHPKWTDDADD